MRPEPKKVLRHFPIHSQNSTELFVYIHEGETPGKIYTNLCLALLFPTHHRCLSSSKPYMRHSLAILHLEGPTHLLQKLLRRDCWISYCRRYLALHLTVWAHHLQDVADCLFLLLVF